MTIFNHLKDTVGFNLFSKKELEDFQNTDYIEDVPDSDYNSESSEDSKRNSNYKTYLYSYWLFK